MRIGGQKDKGSTWEREAGRLLSLWLTDNARPDIFTRNVLSGGAFTVAQTAGKLTSRMPGDLMAAHPLAFQFLSQFMVECKHLRSLELEQFFFDQKAASMLHHILIFAEQQAQQGGLEYMVLAKQNRKPALVFVSGHIGMRMLEASTGSGGRRLVVPNHHFFHRKRVMSLRLDEMMERVRPSAFLQQQTKE